MPQCTTSSRDMHMLLHVHVLPWHIHTHTHTHTQIYINPPHTSCTHTHTHHVHTHIHSHIRYLCQCLQPTVSSCCLDIILDYCEHVGKCTWLVPQWVCWTSHEGFAQSTTRLPGSGTTGTEVLLTDDKNWIIQQFKISIVRGNKQSSEKNNKRCNYKWCEMNNTCAPLLIKLGDIL